MVDRDRARGRRVPQSQTAQCRGGGRDARAVGEGRRRRARVEALERFARRARLRSREARPDDEARRGRDRSRPRAHQAVPRGSRRSPAIRAAAELDTAAADRRHDQDRVSAATRRRATGWTHRPRAARRALRAGGPRHARAAAHGDVRSTDDRGDLARRRREDPAGDARADAQGTLALDRDAHDRV